MRHVIGFSGALRGGAASGLAWLGATLSAAALSGCAGAGAMVQDVALSVESQAAAFTVGADPAPAAALMDRPLVEIGRYARFGSAWHRYEFARRLEYGLGVNRDPACAVYWYRRAAATPRPPGQLYATEPLGAGDTGIWQADIAVRRLGDADDTALDAVTPSRPVYAGAVQRCTALLQDEARFAVPPPPSW